MPASWRCRAFGRLPRAWQDSAWRHLDAELELSRLRQALAVLADDVDFLETPALRDELLRLAK